MTAENNISEKLPASKDRIPKDFKELVRDWSGRVRSTLRRFGINNSDLLNDLEQEAYLRMLKYDIINASDPEKGTFATYVFRIARTIALNHHRTSRRDVLDRAEPLVLHGKAGEEFVHPEVDRMLAADNDQEDKSVIDQFLEILYDEIKKAPAWQSKSWRGTSIKSLSKTCDLMLDGFYPSEIARIFSVSPSAVSNWFKKMKKIALACNLKWRSK